MTASRIHLAVAMLFGAFGVALWAYATHAGHGTAEIAAQMLLIHATALIALTAARKLALLPEQATIWLTSLVAIGVVLFAGDLALRALTGERLFPMATPLGGGAMIAGWAGLALAAAFGRRG